MRGRAFLFTWAQLDSDHVAVFSILEQLPLHRAVIARELHQDGNSHFHAYVELDRPIDRNVTTQFDIDGVHPNIAPKRTKSEKTAARNYCRKETDWINYGYDDDESDSGSDTARTVREKLNLLEAANNSASWAEFLQLAYEQDVPFAYAKSAWESATTRTAQTIVDGEDVPGTISDPGLLNLRFDPDNDPDGECQRAWVVQGPTGVGKTTWALRNFPRPLLVVSQIDDLKALRPGYHRSIVFDDVTFAGDEHGKGAWPVTAQIHMLDFFLQRSVRCRYINAVIPAGMYKCFTANYGRYPLSGDPAVDRRVKNIFL